ncbi:MULTISPECIES: toxin-antitoxin system YwqK family antitoxin [unclassified Dokdonia]|jgi:antitoxin component YwqK of YwqJK toxin-antitoxin module|uniref:toxin-antitoxin system YwqK family antitoxin n=1 Tax=unclassified Dokdonia TaxID=2615033 RepID=UPI00059B9195|nr:MULTISPECIES: hypothetical protein [unclassified Dokdonia]AWH73417.1 nicotinic acid mononucleotide adenyltransferase [Dokdonia sp. Dokd-P16]|tara:strand:- start:90404 stop:90769 length:366 start_codon:yes stop_codon:yes gene_type:complete
MKKIMMIAVAFLMVVSMQAQEKNNKPTYVEVGDLVKATLYFDNGEVSQTGFYTKEGQVTGQWISYNRDGDKTAKAQYDNGTKVGTWFFWSSDKLTEVDYQDSRVASVNTWKNEGSKVASNR